MILRESAVLTLVGIGAGVRAALALTRLVEAMLYGIKSYDPDSIVFGVFILFWVALAESWIPARRGAGIEPREVLRYE